MPRPAPGEVDDKRLALLPGHHHPAIATTTTNAHANANANATVALVARYSLPCRGQCASHGTPPTTGPIPAVAWGHVGRL